MSPVIAVVTTTTTNVVIQSEDGSTRIAVEGEQLQAGDVIVTPEGGEVTLLVDGKEVFTVPGNQAVQLTPDILASQEPAPDERKVDEAAADELLQLLDGEGDLLEELGETAAGAGSDEGPDGEGGSIVRLLRISESTTPVGYEYSPLSSEDNAFGEPEADAVPPQPVIITLTVESSVTEGGSYTVVATLNNPVTGAPFVIQLNDGSVITIPVGESSGAVSVPVREDDVYVQGDEVININVTSTSGGNFSTVDSSTSVSVIVTDNNDVTVITLTTPDVVVEGVNVVVTATVSNPVTGSPLVITLSNGSTITIPVGETSGSTEVGTREDDFYMQGDESLTFTISNVNGGNFEALDSSSSSNTVVVDDNDVTTVTLTSPGEVVEGEPITVTATVSNPVTGTPLVIDLGNGITITIPVGESTGSVDIDTRENDVYVQGNEQVDFAITNVTGGNYEALDTTSTTSTTVTDDNDVTAITLTSTEQVIEGGTITVTATVSQPVTGSPLVVNLDNGLTIVIAVGESSASIEVDTRVDDFYIQGTEEITFAISDVSGGEFEALDTSSTTSSSVIDDNDVTTITLSGPSEVVEGQTITVTATVSNPVTETPLVIDLGNGTIITIPVGESSGSTTVAVRPEDANVQGNEQIDFAVVGTSGGNYEALDTSSTLSTTVVDSGIETNLVLTSTSQVIEGELITVTATVSNAVAGTPLVVDLGNGLSITIPVGATSGSTTVDTREDDVYIQGTDTLTFEVVGTTGGSFDALNTDTSTSTNVIDDADVTTITLTTPAQVTEGTPITVTATVDNPVTGSPLVIDLGNGTSITIAVGQSSGSTTVETRPADAQAQGNEQVDFAIVGTSGGNYEALDTSSTASTVVTDSGEGTTLVLTSDSEVIEGELITVTATVSNPVAGTPLVVDLGNGVSITIPVGASSGSTTVDTRDDDVYLQGTETITFEVVGTTGGNFDALNTDSTTSTNVVDDADPTVITLSTPAIVTEGTPITVTATVDNPVTGSPLVIDLGNGTSITIAVGQSSGSTTVETRPADAQAQGNEQVDFAIVGTSGGNYEALDTSSTASTVVTDSGEGTTLVLTSDSEVIEGELITVTATVSNPVAGTPLVVDLGNGVSITIPVGASSGSTTVDTRDDDVYLQGTETITFEVVGTTGGNFDALNTDSTTSTNVVDDADPTVITLSAPDTITEGNLITVTASVNHPVTEAPLVIDLGDGVSITIAVGESSGSTTVATRPADANVQGDEQIDFAIVGTSGGNYEALDTSSTASTVVTDTGDETILTLTSSEEVIEGELITVTATVSNPVAGTPLVVDLGNGVSITIPVGASSGSTTVDTRDDDVYLQGTDTLTFEVVGTTGGNFDALNTDSTTSTNVVDDADPTVITLSAPDTITEGNLITVTASVNHPVTEAPLVIDLGDGVSITIAVGESSGSTTVATRPADANVQGDEQIDFAIVGTSGGNYEALDTSSTASTVVTDTGDETILTLTSSEEVIEGELITVTATVSNPVAGTPLVVDLGNGVSITIPVGASSGSTTVDTRDDDVYLQGTDTLTFEVVGTTGGSFDALNTDSTTSTNVVDDADPTVITLSAPDTITEGNLITVTASVNHPVTEAPLVIDLGDGVSITIAVGESSGSTTVATRPADANVQGDEQIDFAIVGTSGGNYEALDTSSTASTVVTDTGDETILTLTSSEEVIEGELITVTATVSNPVAGTPLVVDLGNGVSITIPVGASSGSTTVDTRDDDVYLQGTDTVTFEVVGTTGGSFDALNTDSTTSTNVVDDADPTVITLSAPDTITEGNLITVTASVNHPVTEAPLVIDLGDGVSITIAVGESSGSTTVATRPADANVQGDEQIDFAIVGTSGGNYEALDTSSTASTVVTDTGDETILTLTSSEEVIEGELITVTATVSNPVAGTPLVVDLGNGVSITIPVGASSGSTTVDTRDDDVYLQGTDTVTFEVVGTTGGNFDALNTDSTTSTNVVDDADPTVITLSGPEGVTEGGQITITATVDNAPQDTPLVITLTNGEQITIAVGQTVGSVSFDSREDDIYEQGDEWLAIGIAETEGGNYEALDLTSVISVGITDDSDETVLTIGDVQYLEGTTGVITATLSAAPLDTLTVTLSNGATLIFTPDYVPGTVVESTPFDVPVTEHGEPGSATDNSVQIVITADDYTGGQFENLVFVDGSVTIIDDVPTLEVGDTLEVVSGGAESAAAGSLSYNFGADGQGTLTVNGASFAIPTANSPTVIVGANGTLTVNVDGSYSYQANPNTNGETDSFEFVITDADGDTVEATLNVDIVNQPPVGNPDEYLGVNGIVEGAGATNFSSVLANDIDLDGDILTVTQFSANANGSGAVTANGVTTITTAFGGVVIMNADGTFTYDATNVVRDHADATPDVDSFYYQAVDPLGGATNWIQVKVGINDSTPTAEDDQANVVAGESTSGNVLTNDSGLDDPLSVTGVSHPTAGSVNFNNPADIKTDGDGKQYIELTTDAGTLHLYADGSYTYTANPVNTTVVVSGSNLAAWTSSVDLYGFVGAPVNGSGSLNLSALTTTAQNAISWNGGSKPGVGVSIRQSGKVDDGEYVVINLGEPATSAAISVNQFNASQAQYSIWSAYDAQGNLVGTGTFEGVNSNGTAATLSISENDVTGPFTYISVGFDTNGQNSNAGFVINGLVYSVIPDNSEDTFTYQMQDQDGSAASAELVINIGNAPELTIPEPDDEEIILQPQLTTIFEDSVATGNVLDGATEADRDVLTVATFTVNGNTYSAGVNANIANVGTLVVNADGSYTFTPAANWNGVVPVVSFGVTDGFTTVTSTLAVTVTPVNDAPTSADGSTVIAENNSTYTFELSDFAFADAIDAATGQDHALINVIITELPADGSLALNGVAVTVGQTISVADIAGSGLTYTAANNSSTSASFKFKVQDNGGTANGGIDTSEDYNFNIDIGRITTVGNGNDTINGGGGDDVLLGDVGGSVLTVTPGTNYNIALIVDESGSMTSASGQPGLSRQALVKQALTNLASQLADHDGVVNISLIGFARTASTKIQINNLTSANLQSLLNQIDLLGANEGTNFEAGFRAAVNWFNQQSASGFTSDNNFENVTFFLTDGNPTYYYVGSSNTVSGDGYETSSNIAASHAGSIDGFVPLANISKVNAIGIGTGISENILKFYDNTGDITWVTDFATSTMLANFSSNSGWGNTSEWLTTGAGSISRSASGGDMRITDTANDGQAYTAASPEFNIVNGANVRMLFDYRTSNFNTGDTFVWRLEKLVDGVWQTQESGSGASTNSFTTISSTNNYDAGTYRFVFAVSDNSGNSTGTAQVRLDNIRYLSLTPTGEVEIVNNANDLEAALNGGSSNNDLAPVGNDTINGGAGNDIIFGDVINTDGNVLDWASVGGRPANLAEGAGLNALKVFLKLQNGGVDPTDAQLYEYIRENHDDFNVAGDTRGGNDIIKGGAGDDIIYGQGGNDIIYGGAGNDILYGGAGADTFVWELGDEGTTADPARDIVKDFNLGEGDKLVLGDLLPGIDEDNWADYLEVLFEGGNTIIRIKTDPSSDVTQEIVLESVNDMTEQDIIDHILQYKGDI